MSVLQVHATGPENEYLNADDEVSLFTTGYMKPTHYAKESIDLPIQGQTGFGQTMLCSLNKHGDLVGRVYIVYTLPGIRHRNNVPAKLQAARARKGRGRGRGRRHRYNDSDSDSESSESSSDSHSESSQSEGPATAPGAIPQEWAYWGNAIAHVVTEWVAFQIGGQDIDKHFGEWMEIWDEYTCKAGKETDEMVGRYHDEPSLWQASQRTQTRYAKLRFFFCEYLGMALPVLAIHYSHVRLVIKTRPLEQCWISSDKKTPYLVDADREVEDRDLKVQVFANIYILTEKERSEINNAAHEFIITQNQYNDGQAVPRTTSALGGKVTCKLPFNHPVNELIVTLQDEAHRKKKDWFNWSGKHNMDPIAEMGLTINNNSRVSMRKAGWFRMCEPDEHHSKIPKRFIYSCSFAASPEETDQPTGSLNMSRLDDVSIQIVPQKGLGNARLNVWGRSHNIFRVTRGICGTSFS